MTTTKNLIKLGAGRYQYAPGEVIEKRPAKRIGRNGFALAGWAVIKDGREVDRFSTLAKATRSLAGAVA